MAKIASTPFTVSASLYQECGVNWDGKGESKEENGREEMGKGKFGETGSRAGVKATGMYIHVARVTLLLLASGHAIR